MTHRISNYYSTNQSRPFNLRTMGRISLAQLFIYSFGVCTFTSHPKIKITPSYWTRQNCSKRQGRLWPIRSEVNFWPIKFRFLFLILYLLLWGHWSTNQKRPRDNVTNVAADPKNLHTVIIWIIHYSYHHHDDVIIIT